MRKHGWQLPYHPLQVVAVAVFLALGFAFYVFFVPFLGSKVIQYLVMGLYTPLVSFVFCLYICCAATDPADPGVFKSIKYLHVKDGQKQADPSESKRGSNDEANVEANGEKTVGVGMNIDAVGNKLPNRFKNENSCCKMPFSVVSLTCYPLYLLNDWCLSHKQSSEQQTSEDGMFYCSLCEVEVLRYSKHCRVCDKCVDSFDHHCRWLNNCIGRRNYRRFFILMISALLLLILQWSVGILVLVLCFVERNRFSVEITSKLGSSFSLVPFVVVVASCTLLAMVATLPLAQLFFFHLLLIKKGISTYDYIIALREQDQQGVGQQSPQMSPMSSLTGLSSASSFSAFHRGAWCTPPRLFLEDQFDVVPPEIATSLKYAGKRTVPEEPSRKRNAGTVRISPWALARLNADEVSKAAAEARKKSKVLQPVGRIAPRSDNGRRPSKMELPHEPLAKISASASAISSEASASLAPLQLEARSAFRPARALTLSSIAAAASSPDSSLESPDLNPFRVSSSGAEESQWPASVSSAGGVAHKGVQLSRSTSDGYDASGGEDSDRVSSRIVHRSSNWSSLLFGSGRREDSKASCSASLRHV